MKYPLIVRKTIWVSKKPGAANGYGKTAHAAWQDFSRRKERRDLQSEAMAVLRRHVVSLEAKNQSMSEQIEERHADLCATELAMQEAIKLAENKVQRALDLKNKFESGLDKYIEMYDALEKKYEKLLALRVSERAENLTLVPQTNL